MTSPFPRPLPAAKPRPLPAAAAHAAGAAGSAVGDRGRRGLAALAVAGLVLFGGVAGGLYISGGAAVGGAVPPAPSAPAPAAQAARAAAAPTTDLAAGIGQALQDYECQVTPTAGGRVLVPADFGKFSCVIISATAQPQVGGGFVAPCVSSNELQQFLDAQHGTAATGASCMPAMMPNKEAELGVLGCKRLSYFFSSGRKYVLCN